MKRGRKPKAAAIKEAEGNRGKRPINEWVQPKRPKSALAAPAHLDLVAATEWRRLSREMQLLGTLTSVDRAAFTAYCQCWSTYVHAQQRIDANAKNKKTAGGLLMTTAAGNVIQDPLIGIRNTALRDLVRYAVEFGFTPASRVRVEIAAPGGARLAAQAAGAAAASSTERKFFDD